MEAISGFVSTSNIRRVAFSETPRVYVFVMEPNDIEEIFQEAKKLAEEFVDACVTAIGDEDRKFYCELLAFCVKRRKEGDLEKTLERNISSTPPDGFNRLCSIIHNEDQIDDHQKLMKRLLDYLEFGTDPVRSTRLTHTVKLSLIGEFDTTEQQIITNMSSMSGSVAEAPMSGQVAPEALNAIDEIHMEEPIACNISSTPTGVGLEVSLRESSTGLESDSSLREPSSGASYDDQGTAGSDSFITIPLQDSSKQDDNM